MQQKGWKPLFQGLPAYCALATPTRLELATLGSTVKTLFVITAKNTKMLLQATR